jgi:hypothetical protein
MKKVNLSMERLGNWEMGKQEQRQRLEWRIPRVKEPKGLVLEEH